MSTTHEDDDRHTSRGRVLLVVDVQNDFCEGGALAVTGGVGTAERIAAMLAGEHGYDAVVATRDRHIDPGDHFSEAPDFRDTWPAHCVADTFGAELRHELAAVPFAAIFDKGAYCAAYSGFEGTDVSGTSLADWLRSRGHTAVDVCGIATDHCVRATAADALREGFDTRVLADFTAAVDPARGAEALSGLAADGAEVSGALRTTG